MTKSLKRYSMGKIDELIQQYCPDLPAGRQVGWNIEVLPNDESRWYTYVLLCDNATLYKGFTNNLEKRYKRHCAGDGADYTRKNKPLGVVYYETFSSQEEAVKREKYFKSGSGREWLKEKIKEEIYERCK